MSLARRPRRPCSRLSRIAGLVVAGFVAAPLFSCLPAQAQSPKRERAQAHRNAARHPAPPAIDYAKRTDVREFIGQMVERHAFEEPALERLFSQVRYVPDVLRLIAPPPPGFKRSWEVYRTRFLDPLRVREGLRFWRENAEAVTRASQTYGVPGEILVSIIGVETIYGRITGEFRVMDSLSTLAFDYPRRAAYFREELEQLLLYARDAALDPFALRGSFAGAIGLPQFMPGSIRRFAVDFDGDGRLDLRTSPADAIGSVGRFLAEHGWVKDGPTHFDARIADAARIASLVAAGIEPRFTIEQLRESGVDSPSAVPAELKLALIDLPNGDKPPSYSLGAPNFYVITRYNRSSFYAMAVIELATVLRESR